VRSSRNPFQLWIIGSCALTGLLGLLPLGDRTGAVDRYLPNLAPFWYMGLLAAGVISLLGILLPTKKTCETGTDLTRHLQARFNMERTGLSILTGLLAGYGGALLVTVPRAPTAVLMLGLSVASLARIQQLNTQLRALRIIRSRVTPHVPESTDTQ